MFRRIAVLSLVVLLAAFAASEKPTPYSFPTLRFFPPMPVAADNPVTVEGADLGRHLFYDPILSEGNDMSCASCHKQQNAFSDAPNAFTMGRNGALMQRNTMPLFNLAWNTSFFWDGRAATLEEQVFHPIRSRDEMGLGWEMAMKRLNQSAFYKKKFSAAFGEAIIDSQLVAKAIGQFLRTLISNNSKYDQVLAGNASFNQDELAGFLLLNNMTKGDCLHCHSTDADALGTNGQFSNNGLDYIKDPELYKDKGLGRHTGKATDHGKFKIPSLRNVTLTAPYMHDGRFKTLEEVLDFYSEGVQPGINTDSKMGHAHRGGVHLTAEEKSQVIAFLHTLTDSVFATDPAFGNPFGE